MNVIASGFDIAAYFGIILDPRPRWRNWQTRQIKDLVGVKSRGGSSPLLGISIRIDARCMHRASSVSPRVFFRWSVMADRKRKQKSVEPVIENRKARHNYDVGDTLECGLELKGTEIKSVRDAQVSLAEGWIRAVEDPPSLSLHGVHIAEYPPAGVHRQHDPIRTRRLLAHKREIKKFATEARSKGATLVPLKIYFLRGRAKLLIGIGLGKQKGDKRSDIAKRDATRAIERAMSRRR